MPKGPFLPSDFTATKFSAAADKAEFGNILLRFIESEWASALFTKSFYNRLSMCFGHTAHYCRSQFYEEWFSSLATQVRFLKHTLRFPCYGDPEYTFSDVERAIQRVISNRNYLARYELRLAEEQQATDLALLRQISARSTSAIVRKTPVSGTCAKTIGATDSTYCCVNRSVAVEINLEACSSF